MEVGEQTDFFYSKGGGGGMRKTIPAKERGFGGRKLIGPAQ